MAKYTLMINRKTGARSVRIASRAPWYRGEIIRESDSPERYAELRKRALRNLDMREHDVALREIGLVKTPYGWE